MQRDFAIRIDSLLAGVRMSLESIVEHMRRHIERGDISEEEFKQFTQFVGKTMYSTFQFSEELWRLFPDITPEEARKNPPKSN